MAVRHGSPDGGERGIVGDSWEVDVEADTATIAVSGTLSEQGEQMRKRELLLPALIAVLAVATLQAYAWDRKITTVDEETYFDRAFDLRINGQDRVGYHIERHGAVFVHTTASGATGQRAPEREEIEPVRAFMQAELDWLPWKAALEGVWYALVAVALTVSFMRAARLTPRRAAYRGALAVWKAWCVFLLPLWLGYGQPVFSNWIGPGALSWSGPYFYSEWTPGLTVSYRPLVEALALMPALALEPVLSWLLYFVSMPVYLAIIGAPAALVMGAGIGGASAIAVRDRARGSRRRAATTPR